MKHLDDIQTTKETLQDILLRRTYVLDYYQREYSWKKEHITQLIEDLQHAFQEFYDKNHEPDEVEQYGTYYMGPVVFSKNVQDQRTIVDGQQRLTSLTLLLIYLEHQQNDVVSPDDRVEEIRPLIYTSRRRSRRFKIWDQERDKCMGLLMRNGKYRPEENDNVSVKNIADRYENIQTEMETNFEKNDEHKLTFFIDWLITKVIFVSIIAENTDKAYLIFETMNDRGSQLSAVDMLKAYLLSNVKNYERQKILNGKWKFWMQKLNEQIGNGADRAFFQAWLRGHYAKKIRDIKKGAPKEDFEKIDNHFHVWFRNNDKNKKIKFPEPDELINQKMPFYAQYFLDYRAAKEKVQSDLRNVYQVNFLRFSESLLAPLILAPIEEKDNKQTVNIKMNLVARYMEIFCVRRRVNFKGYPIGSHTTPTYHLIKDVRHKDEYKLKKILKEKLEKTEDNLSRITTAKEGSIFTLTGNNKKFVKFFLACLTVYIEQRSDRPFTLEQYMAESKPKIKAFEIEHIMANNFKDHEDEYKTAGYENKEEFDRIRQLLGGLVLLSRSTNRSFSDRSTGEKGRYYANQPNLLAQSLCASCYRHNTSFVDFIKEEMLPFKWYINDETEALDKQQENFMSDEAEKSRKVFSQEAINERQELYLYDEVEKSRKVFSKKAVYERQELYQAIAEKIWGLDAFEDD